MTPCHGNAYRITGTLCEDSMGTLTASLVLCARTPWERLPHHWHFVRGLHGNAYRITGTLCEDSIGYQWIPFTKCSCSWHEKAVKQTVGLLVPPHYWSFCKGNPPVISGFHSQKASNEASVSMSWRIMCEVKWCASWRWIRKVTCVMSMNPSQVCVMKLVPERRICELILFSSQLHQIDSS